MKSLKSNKESQMNSYLLKYKLNGQIKAIRIDANNADHAQEQYIDWCADVGVSSGIIVSIKKDV